MKRRTFRRSTGSRKRRQRMDWVYRDDGRAYSVGGNVILTSDNLGTYSPNAQVLSSPVTAGLILYDSTNYLETVTHGGTGFMGSIGRWARAEGRRPYVHGVEGIIVVDTSSWAVNSQLIYGVRIGVFQQDVQNGQLLSQSLLSMFVDQSQNPVAALANMARQNLWERRVYREFTDSTSGFHVLKVKARFKCRLAPGECLGAFFELASGSVNTRNTWWLRTLVSDEG